MSAAGGRHEPTGALVEHLEKLFSDSFKREIDQDESVWRSLPLFATAMGFALGVVGYAAARLPPFSPQIIPVFVYFCLLLAVLSLLVTFYSLFRIAWWRRYRFPPKDGALRQHALALLDYHGRMEADAATAEREALRAFRTYMVEQLSASTTNNRAHNELRQSARTTALVFLLIGLAFVFASIATIFMTDRLVGRPPDVGINRTKPPGAGASRSGPASAPAP